MSEEDTPAPEQEDTPEVSAPPEGHAPETPDPVNWEQRYTDLRPQFDRATQELSTNKPAIEWWQALQSEETRPQALKALADQIGPDAVLEALGYAEADDGEPDEPVLHDPRVDDLLAAREEETRERELDQVEQTMESEIKRLATEAKLDLDDDDRELIFARALTSPPGQDGTPDVEGAFKKLTGYRDKVISGYRGSKKAPAPPQKGGSSGEPVNQPETAADRRALALQVANEAMEGEG